MVQGWSWLPVALAAALLLPALTPHAGADALEDLAREEVLPWVPKSQGDMLLLGSGPATAKRNNTAEGSCGTSLMTIEASFKPGGFEPTVTITYGGGRAEGPLMMPCLMGHIHQPVKRQIFGDFAGAWNASQNWGGNGWNITVGAPDPEGYRLVDYEFWMIPGGKDTFRGRLLEYR